ncbi:YcxB family protein [Geothermobacter ehrlichii]|nr:YcxB family protein [Geothermobacter ehrlichii]
MSRPVLLSYELTAELWRRFLEAHYACDRSLKWRYLWGVCCIVIGCLGFGGFYESGTLAALLLVTGFYGVLSKPLLVVRSLRRAGRHPFFGRELTVSAGPEELAVRSGNEGYSQPWDNFAGYRQLDPGLLLYHDHDAFFFIPAQAMSAGDRGRIREYLEAAGVPRW